MIARRALGARLRGLNTILLVFVIALLITNIVLMRSGHPIAMPGDKDAQGLEYKDFITIVLTALAVMVAVATLLLAALAVYGYGALREEAVKTASVVAARTVRERMPVQTTADEAEKIANAIDPEGKSKTGTDVPL